MNLHWPVKNKIDVALQSFSSLSLHEKDEMKLKPGYISDLSIEQTGNLKST